MQWYRADICYGHHMHCWGACMQRIATCQLEWQKALRCAAVMTTGDLAAGLAAPTFMSTTTLANVVASARCQFHTQPARTLLRQLLGAKLFPQRGLAGVHWPHPAGLSAAIPPHRAAADPTPLKVLLYCPPALPREGCTGQTMKCR